LDVLKTKIDALYSSEIVGVGGEDQKGIVLGYLFDIIPF
jgi:hypothetical protein